MQVNYYGLGCFRLQTTNASILFEPFEQSVGLKLPRMQNDLVICSTQAAALNKSGDFLVTGPGEYERKNVFIYGQTWSDNVTAYIIEVERVRLAYLGPLKKKTLTNEQLDFLDGVDVLFVPVGGGEVCSAEEAMDIIGLIEPRVVIPMYYQIPGLKTKLAEITDFKKQTGVAFEEVDKLKLTRDVLPEEGEKFYQFIISE